MSSSRSLPRGVAVAFVVSSAVSSAARGVRAQGFGDGSLTPTGGAEEPAPDPTPVAAKPSFAREPRFGDVRRCALSGWSSLDFLFGSYSESPAKDSYVGGDLGVDCFVFDRVSLGGFAVASRASTTGFDGTGRLVTTSRTQYGAGARIGYDLPLASSFSLWTRVGLDARTNEQSGAGTAPTFTEHPIGAVASSLLLAHLAPHFFVGFGPRVYVDIARSNDQSPIENKRLAYGASLIIGGWL